MAAYLTSLVYRRPVYLDLDDLGSKDLYGRVVAVVCVRYDATHLLNINEALLRAGLAEVADFPNEFDPIVRTLYVAYQTGGSLTAGGSAAGRITGAAIIVTVAFAFFLGLRSRKRLRPG